ncbi:MAG TPA: PASTA domain-containing protein [Pyrinomonadaceae bacterium]
MAKPNKIIVDEQTGQAFEALPEHWFDVLSAWISAAYSLMVIGYLGYVVLDVWSEAYKLWPSWITKQIEDPGSANVFKLIVYTAVGGGMGAAVNNIRGFVSWHAERRAFGWRFIWKYLSLPPLGATLAVLVYGILQGGMAVFNGGNVGGTGTAITSLSAWATGTLAGYGCHKVFIWLDDKVNTLFKVEGRTTTKVPDLVGKTSEEAEKALEEAKLKVGEVTKEKTTNPAQIGKVITQRPEDGVEIACDSKVNFSIGEPSKEAAPPIDPTKPNGQEKPADEEVKMEQ